MVTEREQTQFNLAIIREGLIALSSPSDEQLSLNKKGLAYLDDIFDPMPLDYLPWLEEKGTVDSFFVSEIKALYKKIENSVGHLKWQNEDQFISQNSTELQQWRNKATMLLDAIKNV